MKKYILLFISITIILSANSAYNKGRKAYKEQDYFDALKYFYVSARNNNVNAYLELAIMYEKGIGTQANSMTALYWYQKASKKGNLYARKQLSTLNATPTKEEEASIVWSFDTLWDEENKSDIDAKKLVDSNKTSIWYWSELWSEDNSTQETKEDDNNSTWDSMNFWSDNNDTEDINKSSMWSKIKTWSMDDNISKDTTPKPTSREILIDKEEW